jgi:hypothetical protein
VSAPTWLKPTLTAVITFSTVPFPFPIFQVPAKCERCARQRVKKHARTERNRRHRAPYELCVSGDHGRRAAGMHTIIKRDILPRHCESPQR